MKLKTTTIDRLILAAVVMIGVCAVALACTFVWSVWTIAVKLP